MTYEQVISRLKRMANPRNVAGMARFGINAQGTLGISIYDLRKLIREVGTDHRLAQRLWTSGIHEARILAGYIDDPAQVTEAQMERWVRAFDSWDVCDQVTELFARTPHARKKIREWAKWMDSRAARWIASDALRELTGAQVQKRLRAVQRTPRAATRRG